MDGKVGKQAAIGIGICAGYQMEVWQRHNRVAQAAQTINQDLFYGSIRRQTVSLLITAQIDDRLQDRLRLGQDRIFKHRLVGNKGIHGAHPADRRVQSVE